MPSFGAAHLLVACVIVGLVLDSRRVRTLVARSTGRTGHESGSGPALPPGNVDRVGLPLRLVQMRIHVDWQDGGVGWDGPEVLPDEDGGDGPAVDAGLSLFSEGDAPFRADGGTPLQADGDGPLQADAGAPVADQAGPVRSFLPILWQPYPALLAPPVRGEQHPENLVASSPGTG